MPPKPRVVDAPAGIWRIARGSNPLEARIPDPGTLNSSTAGNRFDSPNGEYGVLYFGANLDASFGEVLARKRPDIGLANLVRDEWRDMHFMEPGNVPAEWRSRRSAVQVHIEFDFPVDRFLDVEHKDTILFLRDELALGIAALGYKDLTIGHMRGDDRRVTRLISDWAWRQTDDGVPVFAGIRYLSKICDDWECFAVFGDVPLEVIQTRPLTLDMPELKRIAEDFDLTMH